MERLKTLQAIIKHNYYSALNEISFSTCTVYCSAYEMIGVHILVSY